MMIKSETASISESAYFFLFFFSLSLLLFFPRQSPNILIQTVLGLCVCACAVLEGRELLLFLRSY
ncbi:hypothetical protein F4809DRAFT_588597 [Biscogniauxia mediterranea]|nr:hypothetical protein F4809DRAFT_588597 [Biscogniauxia mediterranea]